jgi:MOSC domain-containing protein YiiM
VLSGEAQRNSGRLRNVMIQLSGVRRPCWSGNVDVLTKDGIVSFFVTMELRGIEVKTIVRQKILKGDGYKNKVHNCDVFERSN